MEMRKKKKLWGKNSKKGNKKPNMLILKMLVQSFPGCSRRKDR